MKRKGQEEFSLQTFPQPQTAYSLGADEVAVTTCKAALKLLADFSLEEKVNVKVICLKHKCEGCECK